MAELRFLGKSIDGMPLYAAKDNKNSIYWYIFTSANGQPHMIAYSNEPHSRKNPLTARPARSGDFWYRYAAYTQCVISEKSATYMECGFLLSRQLRVRRGAWLMLKKLTEIKSEGKAIFVFLHQIVSYEIRRR